jgi:putative transposase
MPRKGRLHIPGGYYHLMGRGLERRCIFSEPIDKADFLKRLGENLERNGYQCLAWSVMSNHYHLLVRAGEQPLSALMAPILGGYAGAYNRRRRRCGYVFQNRFKSILCDESSYFLELVRYIHLNPLRAGIVTNIAELDVYPWAGHRGLLGRHAHSWQQSDEVLSHFGYKLSQARKRYREFVAAGLKKTTNATDNKILAGGGLVRSYGGWEAVSKLRSEHSLRIGDERILGESNFVELALRTDDINLERRSRLHQKGWNLTKLTRNVCALLEVQEEDLALRARANPLSTAKALICFWGINELGLSLAAIARRFEMSPQAVSRRVRQGRALCLEAGYQFESLG